jgi:hypothetical protein
MPKVMMKSRTQARFEGSGFPFDGEATSRNTVTPAASHRAGLDKEPAAAKRRVLPAITPRVLDVLD